jgi:Fungal Zn(2)-Cys(6) binuclear cluster domain
MVGTPKSEGCRTCRKRKIKCDQTRPACRRCQVSGWQCDGYEKNWKFVSENSQLRTQYRQKRYLLEKDEDVIASLSDSGNELLGIKSLHEEYYYDWKAAFAVTVSRLPMSSADIQANVLFYILSDPGSQLKFPLDTHGDYFQFVPNRLGRNSALDDATACLCEIHSMIMTGNSTDSPTVIKLYCRSLASLYSCVQEADIRLEPETLCASIMIQLCELLVSSDNGRWNNLFRGSQSLIKQLGPKSFEKPFERAMLESQRAFILTQSINAGEDCLLAQPEWRAVSNLDISFGDQISPILIMKHRLCEILLNFSELIRQIESIENLAALGNCLQQISSIYRELELFYETNIRAVLLTLNEWDAEDSRKYPDILLARLDCIVNASLAKLQLLHTEIESKVKMTDSTKPEFDDALLSKRLQTSQKAFDFVKANFPMASKPLAFGLQQVWKRGALAQI